MRDRQSYLSIVLFALALLFAALVVTVLITIPAFGMVNQTGGVKCN